MKIFINYGMLTQEDFYEKANKFALLKDTDGKYYTYEEYQSLIKDNQTDKDGNLIYLYSNNMDEQYSYIDAAKNRGYNILLMDGQLDVAMISMLEQKFEKSRFTRVDSDVIDRLIVKEEHKEANLESNQREILFFRLPQSVASDKESGIQCRNTSVRRKRCTDNDYTKRIYAAYERNG